MTIPRQTRFELEYARHKQECNGHVRFQTGVIMNRTFIKVYVCDKCDLRFVNK